MYTPRQQAGLNICVHRIKAHPTLKSESSVKCVQEVRITKNQSCMFLSTYGAELIVVYEHADCQSSAAHRC